MAVNWAREARGPECSTRAPCPGFTLVEVLLAAVLSVLVVVPVLGLLFAGQQTFTEGDTSARLQQDLRVAVDRLTKDLRTAGYDPSGTGAPAPFEFVGVSSLRFIGDADADGTTDLVEFRHDAELRNLIRESWRWAGAGWGQGTGPVVMARNVDRLSFGYFGAGDAPANSLGEIRRVTIEIAASQSAGRSGPRQYAIRSEALLRNLR